MPSTSTLSKSDRTFREKSTGAYSFVMNDQAGDPIPLASLTTLTLTLRNIADDAIINSRNDQNVKNENNVSVGATDGRVTWELQRTDNAIVDGDLESGNEEIHLAFFEYTWDSGAKADSHEVPLYVVALEDIS